MTRIRLWKCEVIEGKYKESLIGIYETLWDALKAMRGENTYRHERIEY